MKDWRAQKVGDCNYVKPINPVELESANKYLWYLGKNIYTDYGENEYWDLFIDFIRGKETKNKIEEEVR